jgi:hypothetical protein
MQVAIVPAVSSGVAGSLPPDPSVETDELRLSAFGCRASVR